LDLIGMTESHALIRTMSELDSLTGAREMYFRKLRAGFRGKMASLLGDEEKQVLCCAHRASAAGAALG